MLHLVDDGTGILLCFLWLNKILFEEVEHINRAHLVSVRGKLNVFREEKEITVESIGK